MAFQAIKMCTVTTGSGPHCDSPLSLNHTMSCDKLIGVLSHFYVSVRLTDSTLAVRQQNGRALSGSSYRKCSGVNDFSKSIKKHVRWRPAGDRHFAACVNQPPTRHRGKQHLLPLCPVMWKTHAVSASQAPTAIAHCMHASAWVFLTVWKNAKT